MLQQPIIGKVDGLDQNQAFVEEESFEIVPDYDVKLSQIERKKIS